MPTIERRVAALETQVSAADANLKVVLVSVGDGETEAEAMARAGCNPDDPSVMCILLVALPKPAAK